MTAVEGQKLHADFKQVLTMVYTCSKYYKLMLILKLLYLNHIKNSFLFILLRLAVFSSVF
jgi:hypothetical protein